ncbi:MAG: hypothetical protein DHS20C17_18750 [Cyclobacteriaceae bacterium]|nr:MAG: hypothetical protein DHS20C17_18750 [Cyclobacteriaceae bacterium]
MTDNDGEPLPSAHVLLRHQPTGSVYGVISSESGRFSLQNVKVGGPYSLTISYVGFENFSLENLYLRLGQEYIVKAELQPADFQLTTVEVIGHKEKIFSEDRTGAATNIDSVSLETLPTIKRSLEDYVRLTPQASILGQGISFAGMNNRYNNFSIDGTVNNDVFGLSSTGTNGGQTGTEPISLDAVEELQMEVAPFDVRYGGFTGGSINAVTRSGTNQLNGSAYYLVNNEKFSGSKPSEAPGPEKLPDYFERTSGVRLGGALIKDKLFAFVSYEQTRRENPSIFNVGAGSSISPEEAQRVENKLIELSGSNQGGFDPFVSQIDFYKFFSRIDWNLNNRHKLTLRYNYVNARQFNLARREDLLQFNNTARNFPSKTNGVVLELRSNIGDNRTNELRLGFTQVDDEQNINGDPFPYIQIDLRPSERIVAGSGRLFTADHLEQKIFTLTDHYTIFKDRHIITLGTHNEFFRFKHLDITDNFGSYSYRGLNSFEAVGTAAERPPWSYVYSYSKLPGEPHFAPNFRALQLAFYVQDEYYVNEQLKLTGGVRAEVPLILDEPAANTNFNEEFGEFGVATDKLPGATLMISPRLGFNLDFSGDRSSQLRGGMGMFVSRIPFVWFSNQFQHTGIEQATIQLMGPGMPTDFKFSSDPFDQPDAGELGLIETEEINVTDPDFRYPKVFRVNIGYDQKLPWNLVGSFDFMYTNRIHDVDYENLNLLPSTISLEGADNRPFFPNEPFSPEYTKVLMLTNTKKGHAYNLTFQLQKPIENGIQAALAYTYGISKDVNSAASNAARANWGFVEQVNGPNSLPLSFSRYDFRSRITGFFQITKSLIKNTRTSAGLFYNGQTGLGISYIYRDDVNNDLETNDLIYIPKDASEIDFVGTPDFTAEQQWEALDDFISKDDYLSDRRGKYAERNGKRMPFEHHFDLKLIQEMNLRIGSKVNRLILTFDIFNLGNLFNNDWGKSYASNQQRVELINYVDGGTTPRFFFDPDRIQSEQDLWTIRSELSRWRGQFGIRYIFQ